MSRGLRHAAVCPAKNHMECPTFQKLVRAAGEGALKGASTGAIGTKSRKG